MEINCERYDVCLPLVVNQSMTNVLPAIMLPSRMTQVSYKQTLSAK